MKRQATPNTHNPPSKNDTIFILTCLSMKNLNLLMVFLCTALSSACCHKNSVSHFKLKTTPYQYTSVYEYFEKRGGHVDSSFWINFRFLNNPYNLNENNIISIYVNNNLVYRGEYKKNLELKGNPNILFVNDHRMAFKLEILTDKTKNKIWEHRFSSKETFSWNTDYKIIYCGFFPTNEDVESVFFIPQLENNP